MDWARVMRGTCSIASAVTPRAASASRSGPDRAGCSSPTSSRPVGRRSTTPADGHRTAASTSAPSSASATDPSVAPAAA